MSQVNPQVDAVTPVKQSNDIWAAPDMPELECSDSISLADTGSPGSVWTEPVSSEPGDFGRDTMIVFDWDDTLLSTAAINRGSWTESQLKVLLHSIEAVLRLSMTLGETLIVTNGNATWVQDSARAYLPDLLPLLDEIKVISARAKYEQEHPGNPFAWKRRAFNELTALWKRDDSEIDGAADERRGAAALNMLVVGDSVYEMEAAESLKGSLMAGSLIKCVKFIETPAIESLIGELKRTLQELPFMVSGTRSQRVNLLRSMRHVASDVEAWTVVDKEEFQQRMANPWAEMERSDNKAIVSSGLLSWVHTLGDQLLCKDPRYLGNFEEAADTEATLEEKPDFGPYLNAATPFATPWQH